MKSNFFLLQSVLILVSLVLFLAPYPTKAAPARLSAAPGDENWDEGFSFVPTSGNDRVYALAIDSTGNLYAGGSFLSMEGMVVNNITRWDGTSWAPLCNGNVCGVNGTVYALAIERYGSALYVGGDFTTAGGVSVNGVAKWDNWNQTWSALCPWMGDCTINGSVHALASGDNGDLYIGGSFTAVGGVDANRIAKWDNLTQTWSALGSGMDSTVRALTFGYMDILYAGGDFINAGGNIVNYIAQWDGETWAALCDGETGLCGVDGVVESMVYMFDGNLYVGGAFLTTGGKEYSYFACWRYSFWSPSFDTRNIGGRVHTLAADQFGNIYIGGEFTTVNDEAANYVARRGNITWIPMSTGMDQPVLAMVVTPDGTLYAGGAFTQASGVSVKRVARWEIEGTSWSSVGRNPANGLNGTVYALAYDDAGNLYAGGDFTSDGNAALNHIARWNGSSWAALGEGIDGPVYALAVDTNGDLYAGGNFQINSGCYYCRDLARWDGEQWAMIAYTNGNIHALAFDQHGNLYVGGEFQTVNFSETVNGIFMGTPPIDEWHSWTWSALGEGLGMNGYAYALAIGADNHLFVGGYFDIGGIRDIAEWDGGTWSTLGGGVDNHVYSLAVGDDGNLYVGGYFTTAGNITANGIARWNGENWVGLGTGIADPISSFPVVGSLAFDSAGNLYAGGHFTLAGDASANNIAKWNGSSWSALGSGLSHDYGIRVYALASYNGDVGSRDDLFAGGTFDTAGQNPSNYIAQWTAAEGHEITSTPGNYTFYPGDLPVNVYVQTPGNLARINIQRHNRNHPAATQPLQSGYFWEIEGLTSSGAPASGFSVNLTLPTSFAPTANDKICRYADDVWDCAMSSYNPGARTITRNNITAFSDWTTGNEAGPTAIDLMSFAAHSESRWVGFLLLGLALATGAFRAAWQSMPKKL